MWIFIVHALFRHFLARYVSPHPSFYKNKSYLKGEIKIRARVLAKSISLRLCITEVYRAYNVEKRKTKFTPIRNPGEIMHNNWGLPSYVLLVFRILYSTFSMCWLLTAVSKDRLKLFAGVLRMVHCIFLVFLRKMRDSARRYRIPRSQSNQGNAFSCS